MVAPQRDEVNEMKGDVGGWLLLLCLLLLVYQPVSIAIGSSTCTTRKPAASAVRTARSTSAALVIPARSAQSLIRRNRPDRPRVVAYRAAMKRAASSRASGVAVVAVSTPRLQLR